MGKSRERKVQDRVQSYTRRDTHTHIPTQTLTQTRTHTDRPHAHARTRGVSFCSHLVATRTSRKDQATTRLHGPSCLEASALRG